MKRSILSLNSVLQRCLQTGAAQASLFESTGWVWFDKPVEGWEADVDQLRALQAAESHARTLCRLAAAVWDERVRQVQERTRVVVALGRVRFRREAARAALFAGLHAGRSRMGVYEAALAARDAWAQADPAWTPETGFTLEVFAADSEALVALQAVHSQKRTALRGAAEGLMDRAREVDADCVAWYAEATRRFPVRTANGEMIRSTITATYRRSAASEATDASAVA
jgi:hypothetical protein